MPAFDDPKITNGRRTASQKIIRAPEFRSLSPMAQQAFLDAASTGQAGPNWNAAIQEAQAHGFDIGKFDPTGLYLIGGLVGGGAVANAIVGGGAAAGGSAAASESSVLPSTQIGSGMMEGLPGVGPAADLAAGTTTAAGIGGGGLGSVLGNVGDALTSPLAQKLLAAGIPALALAGPKLFGGGSDGPAPNAYPPELQQLLAESLRRVQSQTPLFEAASKQAFEGLPSYAKGGR